MKTVLLAGVPQSPNLGDGLIALTLNRLIAMRGAHRVIHFDLLHGHWEAEESHLAAADSARLPVAAGAETLSSPSTAGQLPKKTREEAAVGRPQLAVSQSDVRIQLNGSGTSKRMTPDTLRRWKAYWLDRRRNAKLNEPLRKAVAQADAVFIGGGHLLIDTYWTFPLAVRRIAAEAKRQRKPLHLLLVGARGPWSRQATRWLLGACRYATTIAVRDEDSRSFLLGMDASLSAKTVALADPALYTPETFGLPAVGLPQAMGHIAGRSAAHTVKPANANTWPKSGSGRRPIVGLGIMDPNEMNRHCPYRWEREACAAWWQSAAETLAARGCEVRLFTNGAASDNAFVEQYVKPRCTDVPHTTVIHYPATVAQLMDSIADCDVVIAQRLHACIPAISLGKPTHGIIWDRKLEHIFAELNLAEQLIDFRIPAERTFGKIALDGQLPDAFPPVLERKKRELFEHIGSILP
ncbi:polysaccharide pyruvyl transferase WcaK-like protein [Paenibacillus cellulosilyticus]|uniref:Polysaccharide pyruvyl transferase WcaK-like protein n=1 Tax=Paenibacillus cellulosilyticus TaxID=375489 RepID=A0A2V2Z860_9BACL|nr:polysaccharide pyruvyl transferase family protein [Paenibacillus cellulosilyticus]PWW07546.1 polysaccharide pyruvyl transferase WcaK-like protein [Paenibacillus cellulosilyticus]QKS44305.1 polysaccharide pyruvyl transferase family protein [Paenibacillus cellulosilyticus]